MKTRNGFVSNSSTSSFIVTPPIPMYKLSKRKWVRWINKTRDTIAEIIESKNHKEMRLKYKNLACDAINAQMDKEAEELRKRFPDEQFESQHINKDYLK